MKRDSVKLAVVMITSCIVSLFPLSSFAQNYLTTFSCTNGTGGAPIPGCVNSEVTYQDLIRLTATGVCSQGFVPSAYQYAADNCFFAYTLKVVGSGWNQYNGPTDSCPVNPNNYAIGWVQSTSYVMTASQDAIYAVNLTKMDCTGLGGFSTGPGSSLTSSC